MFAGIFIARTAATAKQQIYNGFRKQISCTTRRYSSRIASYDEVTSPAKEPNYSFDVSRINKEERQQFDNIFLSLVQDVTDIVKDLNIPNLTAWCTRLLENNMSTGRKRRGFAVVLSYKLLADAQELTPEKIRLARIMGCCVEMLTSTCLVIDGIVDQSEMRRGGPYWYKVEDVSLSTINDAVILQNCGYAVLRKYFRDHPCYLHMLELFHDVIMKIGIGQALDCQVRSANTSRLKGFSTERYRTIAMNKSGYFAFLLPVTAAMYLAGIHDTKLHAEARAILQEMGYWAQVKNDFCDCFGHATSNGATLYVDIRKGKCTWPIVVALERASPEQREILDQCYGQKDEQSAEAVMDIFRALAVPSIYASYKEETFQNIRKQIELIDARNPKQIFYNILQIL